MLSVLHPLGVQDYVIHRLDQSLPGALLVPPLILLALSLPWTRAALHGNEIWLEKAYLPGMAAIATGVLGALLADAYRPSRRTVAMLGWLGWLGALGLGVVLLDSGALWHWLRDGHMLVLTGSALCLLLCFRWRADVGAATPLRGFGWLRSWVRMSYEIYLAHMFVVFAMVRAYRAWDGNPAHGWLWYQPELGLCWLLGLVVERWLSAPCERWLRRRMLRVAPDARRATLSV